MNTVSYQYLVSYILAGDLDPHTRVVNLTDTEADELGRKLSEMITDQDLQWHDISQVDIFDKGMMLTELNKQSTKMKAQLERWTQEIKTLYAKIGAGFHLDTECADYITGENKRLFSDAECILYDRTIDSFVRICEQMGVDPYEQALSVCPDAEFDLRGRLGLLVYVATVDTANFTFMAMSADKAEALANLTLGLEFHAKKHNLNSEWWKEFVDSIKVYPLASGMCYRDNEELK